MRKSWVAEILGLAVVLPLLVMAMATLQSPFWRTFLPEAQEEERATALVLEEALARQDAIVERVGWPPTFPALPDGAPLERRVAASKSVARELAPSLPEDRRAELQRAQQDVQAAFGPWWDAQRRLSRFQSKSWSCL